MINRAEYLAEEMFYLETGKSISNLLNALEGQIQKRSISQKEVNALFRKIHGIKGALFMLEYMDLAEVAHGIEDLFDMLRNEGCSKEDLLPILKISLESVEFISNGLAKLKEKASVSYLMPPSISENDIRNNRGEYHFGALEINIRKMAELMCKNLGKMVTILTKGLQTYVDYETYVQISSATMHLIRNSIDHGIELPEQRKAFGKNPIGIVKIEMRKVENELFVQVHDDGIGLDKGKILKRALEQRILTKTDEEMTDGEIYNLILKPGFTTRDELNMYSGRGVGLDAVNTSITEIGGYMIIDSVIERGSSFIMKVPLVRF